MGSCVFWARVGGMIAPQILLSVSFSLIFYMLCVCLLFSQYIDSELLINRHVRAKSLKIASVFLK